MSLSFRITAHPLLWHAPHRTPTVALDPLDDVTSSLSEKRGAALRHPLLIAVEDCPSQFSFDVVNNRIDVLVATGIDSGNREYVQSLAGGIHGAGTR